MGPSIQSKTTRSAPIPERRNRPSAPVMTLRSSRHRNSSRLFDGKRNRLVVVEVLRPGHRGLPGGEVCTGVGREHDRADGNATRSGRPSRSSTRPLMGTSSRASLSVRSLASSILVIEAQAGPNPRAMATTTGLFQVGCASKV